MHAEPAQGTRNGWKQFVGEWTYESECDMGEEAARDLHRRVRR